MPRVRALLIAMALVIGSMGTAEARRGGGLVVIVTGDAIEHIRDLDAKQAAAIGYGKLGYHYQRFGVFWLDLWRDSGEFCVYSGDTYVPLTDEEVAALGGASVPWRYHLPEGLIILVALAYYFLIGRRKRRVKTAFILAGVFAVIALVFFLQGLTWEFMIPLGLALHHALTARAAMKRGDHDEAPATTETPRESPPPVAARPSRPLGTPPPVAPSPVPPPDPSRPSQPLVIERASTAPAAVPMREDQSVDGPKLLR